MSQKKMPWFRMYSEAVDDEKLRLLAFEDRWHFVAILCCKCAGVLDSNDPLLRRKMAVKLGLGIRELDEVVKRLSDVGLIDIDTMQPSMEIVAVELRPSADIWRATRGRIFERDNYTCVYCGKRGVKLECDHVHPVSRGGSNDDDNLATACFDCNRSKRNKTVEEWRAQK